MQREERFRKIAAMFRRGRVVTTQQLLRELGTSLATLKRDLVYVRDRFGWPISEWRSEDQGYRLTGAVKNLDLPGLWFNASEISALLMMQHLLRELEPNLLEEQLRPLRNRLQQVLTSNGIAIETVERRVKVIQLGRRKYDSEHFRLIAGAVLARRQLAIDYWSRERRELTSRQISPIQLVHYRENWVLDGWCHLREGIRTFAVDAVRSVQVLGDKAIEVPERTLAEHFAGGYGLYAGPARSVAHLRFSPNVAEYVALQQWHSQEKGAPMTDGGYELSVPYSSDQELVMDLLRFGSNVEVLGPPELRRKVADAHARAAAQYQPE